MTVAGVLRELARHPRHYIVTQWNWKSAVLSAILRGAIFFTTNLTFGIEAAARALLVDAVFRVPLVGVYAAVTQAFKAAEPAWAASIAVVALAAFAHLVELCVHWFAGTPGVQASVLASIAFSGVSSLFSLFAMRRGVLVVGGKDAAPFGRDLLRLPGIALDFLCLCLRW